ncbi:RIP metalloprotease [Fusobacterium sp. IOR10]|uniref:M50 family metallopeptidase n=1 Tax=Fusobacterium sp. IOR10 TaxID=2665157 RepID=UPI0013D48C8F|nr:M50 family metallopeptidase [Fusobacterium sp. IOR10]
MKIIISLIVLGIVIIIHELGHFLSAKFFKIPVSEFSIGMGPEVYTYDGDRTKYSFRAIPIGGYVNIKGMEIGDDIENGFNKKNPFVRFIVLIAGVFMNFLLAYVILFGMYYSSGEIILNNKPIIGQVLERQSNYKNPLKVNDKILKINDEKIVEWNDIKTSVYNLKNKGQAVNILVLRDNQEKNIQVKLEKNDRNNEYYFGIIPEYTVRKNGVLKTLKLSSQGFVETFKQIFLGFEKLVKGEVNKKEISGPIGIINIVGEASQNGIGSLVWLVAILSINIGIFNLLPFPALDGGRILFIILELLGIKIDKEKEESIHKVGMIMLFLLIIFVTTNDFFNLGN